MSFLKILLAPFDFIMKYFKALVFLLIVFLIFFSGGGEENDEANVARIDLVGPIMQSESFLEEFYQLEQNPNIKGILLVINSPGGGVAPSVEISEAIKRVSKIKPIVAYAQDSMASGSYLAGMWANFIIANKGALLGSIGVILNGVDISELAQKLGIKSQSLKAGDYKEAGTFMRPWNSLEEEMLEGLIQEQYKMFVNDVVQARGLDINNQEYFAQGRILSAANALKLGLIDEIGSIYEAQNKLYTLAGIEEPHWLQKDKFELYLQKLLGDNIALGIEGAAYRIFNLILR
ncbi:signal peptide peptidase SppA [Helicobacter mesocricetorum]|uniref:signal peptide peptidase SppA n=1 Tax=Helicobacter mesocricetorum TaxID=87012 RepID=UPI001F3C4377|nr:signal peptide peptidase SppA [Helicobacter mesocricetorum]